MAISGNYNGGIQRPSPVRLTTTGQTAVYTATDRDTVVGSWAMANETGSGVLTKCYWKDGTTSYLVWSGTITANGAEIVCDAPLRMYPGDTFEVTAASSNAITVTPVVVRSQAHAPAEMGAGRLSR